MAVGWILRADRAPPRRFEIRRHCGDRRKAVTWTAYARQIFLTLRKSGAIVTINGLVNRGLAVATAAAVLSLVGAADLSAQTSGGASVPSFTKLPDSIIAQFKADPRSLLTTYASAGLPLSTRIRSLVLTDPSLVGTLIDLAKSANDAQRAAMGAGLAEAARSLAVANPQLAAQIQMDVAQSGLAPLITAFVAGSNGVQTAATGGGGASGGGGAGSGGPVGGVGNNSGSNGGASPGGVSFGAANSASPFGSLGPSGGVTSTSLSTSPSSL